MPQHSRHILPSQDEYTIRSQFFQRGAETLANRVEDVGEVVKKFVHTALEHVVLDEHVMRKLR